MRKPEFWDEQEIVGVKLREAKAPFEGLRDALMACQIRNLQAYITHLEQRESREGKLREAAVLNLCREFLEAVDDEYEEEQPGRNQNGFMDAVGFARSKVYAEKSALADGGARGGEG